MECTLNIQTRQTRPCCGLSTDVGITLYRLQRMWLVERHPQKNPYPVWELPGTGVGGFNPQLMSSTPLVVLLYLSWGGVRNNPHRSQLQTLICHHIPQVIEHCHCCQAYVPFPQSEKDASCSCSASLQNTFWPNADFSCIKYQCIANLNRYSMVLDLRGLLSRIALCQRVRSVITRTRYINVLTYLLTYLHQ